MAAAKRVMLIGLHPDVVNYEKWPGLTAERLCGAMERDLEAMRAKGLSAEVCFVDHGETAAQTVADAMTEAPPDIVLIGAGVRTDPDEFLLFERLLNQVHRAAPQAALCFNTGPTDSVAAVERWL